MNDLESLDTKIRRDLNEIVAEMNFDKAYELHDMALALRQGRLVRRAQLWYPDRGYYLILPFRPWHIRRMFFDSQGYKHPWVCFVRSLLALSAVVSLIAAAFVIPLWIMAVRSADVYNSLNGTHYTASDFFWAGDQINASTHTIRLK